MSAETRFSFSELLDRIAAALPAGVTLYLVGGSVRDGLLGRPLHDLDFVLSGEVLSITRLLGDRLGAAYYPLDEERETGRLVYIPTDGPRQMLDFARMQGADLESDLRLRDFTINAMAIDVSEPTTLIDPLGGAADLRAGKLRACSPSAFTNDPLRVLRAIRQAFAYELKIVPETRTWMRKAVPQLPQVSSERLRDEIFRILGGPQPAACLRALELIDALPLVLPELPALKGVTQSAPHTRDVWNHTLDVLQKLSGVLEALSPTYDPDSAASLLMGLAVLRLGRYRQQIGEHVATPLTPDRPLRPLLFLAALYHDIAKPQTRTEDQDGRVRFYGHDQAGAEVAAARARAFRLSNSEVDRLKKIVHHHMRPLLLAQAGQTPSRRAIYRFFRDTGPAGVDICLLSLADVLATQGAALATEEWVAHLDVVRALLEAWWEKPQESVAPPLLLSGKDMIAALGLEPGPQIGQLLESIREAQAGGQVSTAQEALELARSLVTKSRSEFTDRSR